MGSIVDYLYALGDDHTARTVLQRRHTALHDILGPEHEDTLTARVDLASPVGAMGDVVDARDRFTTLTPLVERLLGPDHLTTLDAHANLAHGVGETGDAAGARDRFAALVPVLKRVWGPTDPDVRSAGDQLDQWTARARWSLVKRLLLSR